MKIFEVTKPKKLKESKASDLVALLAVVKQKKSAADADETNVAPAVDANATAGDTSIARMMEDLEAKIKSGEAKLSKDIDAELGKRGADPQDIHISIMSKVQEAGRNSGQQIAQSRGLSGQEAVDLMRRVEMWVTSAAFGYINKKYLGGDDTNYNMQTMDIVTRALQSQAPIGGQVPVGQVSSARPAGVQGTVPAGSETNALDARAERDF